MPPDLKKKIQLEAFEAESNTNDVILRALSEQLGVPFASNRRRSVPFGGGRRKEPMASTNGHRPRSEDKVRVAIIGVGNCANSLLQGLEYYREAPDDRFVPGLMHVNLGGYHISDIEVTAAFDVVKGKVGLDLADAMWAHPNDTIKFADVPKTGVRVSRGMTHDGLGKYLSEIVEKAEGPTDDVVGILRETGTDVVVNYLPVGSEEATKWYTEQILNAGCAMVNCMPVFTARERYWQKRFEDAGVPIIGDDIKSQVGATITHRVLTSLFRERGVHLDRTMQLNVGGNSDFLNMLERERLESKKISKTNAVTSMLDYDLGAGNVHVGPSDHVPWLTDRKWAYIRMEGSSFGDVPLNLELKLEVWDSPNSAGIVIDAVRLAKLALNNGVAGALEAPSSYLMKSPPKQIVDDEALRGHREVHQAVHPQAGKGSRSQELMRRARLARLFWIGAAALLCAAALVALVALLRGRFTDTDARILLTVGALFLAGSAGIAGYALVERGTAVWLGWAAVATAPVWFAILTAAIWSESLGRLATTTATLLAAELVATTDVLMLRNRRFVPLVAATGGALALTTLFVIVAIWGEGDAGSTLARAIGGFAILTALGYFLLPVLQRFVAAPAAPGAVGETVLAALGDVELVASREAVEGVEVKGRPQAGERLFLRRRRPARRRYSRSPPRDGATKPIRWCDLSQNGLFSDAPQRQSAYEVPAGSSYSFPSMSTIVIGPETTSGPFSLTLISTSVMDQA